MSNLDRHIRLAGQLGLSPAPLEVTHGTQALLYMLAGVPMGERVHKPLDFSRLATLAREGKRGRYAYGDSVNMNITRWEFRGEG